MWCGLTILLLIEKSILPGEKGWGTELDALKRDRLIWLKEAEFSRIFLPLILLL